jgi:outer membrane protein OmpA-like peptidoglycan-associated protein
MIGKTVSHHPIAKRLEQATWEGILLSHEASLKRKVEGGGCPMAKRAGRFGLIVLAVIVLSVPAPAVGQDMKGCQDHPLFTRMPDFVISNCKASDFDFFEFDVTKDGRLEKVRVEGRKTVIDYRLKTGAERPGALNIIQNHVNAIKAIGGKVLRQQTGVATLMTAKDDRETWAKVAAGQVGSGYELTIVEKAAMVQEVTADAASMAQEIQSTGRVAIYGIYFDFNKSDLKPESKPALDEIAKLLGQDPQLMLYVVGHTDGVGEISYNMTLSQARAEAVVKTLVADYRVGAGRLKPYGVGPLAPVAVNTTEEGRAKNRRVELVRH